MRFLLVIFLLIATNVWAVESRIYAQRVAMDGSKTGSAIQLNSGTIGQPQSQPRVAFYDDRFLVVYHEWNGTDNDVKAVRLSINGTVLDTTPITIADGAYAQVLPDVASDTTGWMVVWQSFSASSHFPSLKARRVNYDGSLGGTTLTFGDGSDFGSYPRIAYNSTEDTFGVVFSTSRTRDRSKGYKALVSIINTTPGEDHIGTNYVSGETQCYFLYSITADPSSGWIVAMSGKPAQPLNVKPGIVALEIDSVGDFAVGNYMNGSENITSAWLSHSTEFVDTRDDPATYIPFGITAVTMDSTYAVVAWERWNFPSTESYRATHSSIRAGRLDGSDLVETLGGTEMVGLTSTVSYEKPALAGDGAGLALLTYDKRTNGAYEIGSKLLTISGSVSPGSEVIIKDTTGGNRRSQSAVAYGDDGTTEEFMVVWTEGWWGTP